MQVLVGPGCHISKNSHQILFISTNLPSFPPLSPSPLTPSRMQQHLIVLYWYTAFHLYGSRIYVFFGFMVYFWLVPKGMGFYVIEYFGHMVWDSRYMVYLMNLEVESKWQFDHQHIFFLSRKWFQKTHVRLLSVYRDVADLLQHHVEMKQGHIWKIKWEILSVTCSI